MPHLQLLSVYGICGFYSGADLCCGLWVMIHCSPVSGHQVFGGTYCLHLQGRGEWSYMEESGKKWVTGYGSGQLEPWMGRKRMGPEGPSGNLQPWKGQLCEGSRKSNCPFAEYRRKVTGFFVGHSKKSNCPFAGNRRRVTDFLQDIGGEFPSEGQGKK
jgi:hypothetical protein